MARALAGPVTSDLTCRDLCAAAEWLNGRGGRLTLSDTDLSSVTLHGWRRVNTLSHYGLEETARLALVARHSDEYTNYSEPYSNREWNPALTLTHGTQPRPPARYNEWNPVLAAFSTCPLELIPFPPRPHHYRV